MSSLALQSISQSTASEMSSSESLMQSFHVPPTSPLMVSRNDTGMKKDRVRYKIEFPPGSMGLELEPVIKSAQREIGCRVRDFYFEMKHQGIDPAFLMARVQIGHVISSINGEDIKSWSFPAILDKLRSLKEETRVISFRNISATWEQGLPLDVPSVPPSPAQHNHHSQLSMIQEVSPLVVSFPIGKLERTTSLTRDENNENDQQDRLVALTTPVKSSRKSYPLSVQRTPTASAVTATTSTPLPNSNANMSHIRVDPNVNLMQSFANASKVNSLTSAASTANQTSFSLSVSNPANGNATAVVSNRHSSATSTMKSLQSPLHAKQRDRVSFFDAKIQQPLPPPAPQEHSTPASNPSELPRLLTTIGSSLGSSLAMVGARVGDQTRDAAEQLSHVVNSHAELLSQSLPRYSVQEMRDVLQSKHGLLSELATAAIRLGEQQTFHREFEMEHREIVDALQLKIRTLEAQMSIIHSERQEELQSYQQLVAELHAKDEECAENLQSFEQQLQLWEDEKQQLNQEKVEFIAQLNELGQEMQKSREECDSAMMSAREQIDKAEAENEVLRDVFSSQQQALKEQHRESLLAREREVQEVRIQLQQLQLDSTSKEDQLQSRIDGLEQEIEVKLDALRILEDQVQLQAEELVSASERFKMSQMTITTLQMELSLLQKENSHMRDGQQVLTQEVTILRESSQRATLCEETVRKQLTELQIECSQFQEESNQFRQELLQSQTELMNTKQNLQLALEQCERVSQDRDAWQSQCEDWSQRWSTSKSDSQQQHNRFSSVVKDMQQQISTMRAALSELKQETRSHAEGWGAEKAAVGTAIVQMVENLQSNAFDQRQQLQAESDQWQTQLKQLRSEYSLLIQQHNESMATLQRDLQRVTISDQSKESAFLTAISRAEEHHLLERNALVTQLNDLQIDIQREREICDQLRSELDAKDDVLRVHQTREDQLLNDRDAVLGEKNELLEELSQANEEASQLRSELTQRNALLNDQRVRLHGLEEEIKSLHARTQENDGKAEEAHANELVKLQQEHARSIQSLRDDHARVLLVRERMDESKTIAFDKQLSSHRLETLLLGSQLSAIKVELASLLQLHHNIVTALQSKSDESNKEIDSLRARLATRQEVQQQDNSEIVCRNLLKEKETLLSRAVTAESRVLQYETECLSWSQRLQNALERERELQSQCDEFRMSVEQLSVKMQSLTDLDMEVGKLRTDKAVLTQSLLEAQTENSRLTLQLGELFAKNGTDSQQKNTELLRLQTAHDQWMSQCHELRDRVAVLERDQLQARDSIESMRAAALVNDQEREEMRLELHSRTIEFQNQSSVMGQRVERLQGELVHEVSSRESLLHTLRAQLHEYRTQCNEFERQSKELSTKAESLEYQLSSQQTQQKEDIQDRDARELRLQEEIAALRLQQNLILEQAKQHCTGLELERDSLQEELATMTAQHHALNSKIERFEALQVEQQEHDVTQASRWSSERTSLQDQLVSLTEHMASVQGQLSEKDKLIDTLTQDFQTISDRETSLSQSIHQLHLSLSMSRERNQELTEECERQCAVHQVRERELVAALESTVEHAKKREDEHREMSQRFEEALKSAEKARHALQLTLTDKENDVRELLSALELMLRESHNGQVLSLSTRSDDSNGQRSSTRLVLSPIRERHQFTKLSSDSVSDKENSLPCIERTSDDNLAEKTVQDKNDVNSSVCDEWIDELLTLSLALHETLTVSFPIAFCDCDIHSDSPMKSAWISLSHAHHLLHQAIVRAPWQASSGSSVLPSLTPAHELALLMMATTNPTRSALMKSETAPSAMAFPVAARFVIKLLIRNWRKQREALVPVRPRVHFGFNPSDDDDIVRTSNDSMIGARMVHPVGNTVTEPLDLSSPLRVQHGSELNNSLYVSPARDESFSFSLSMDLDESFGQPEDLHTSSNALHTSNGKLIFPNIVGGTSKSSHQ